MQKKELIVTGYREIEALIFAHFGKSFSVIADQEANNGSNIFCKVVSSNLNEDNLLDAWTVSSIKQFKETGQHTYLLNDLLNVLCAEGKLEAGEYLIQVWW